MADPTTTNILLDVPTRGSDPGTWDIPVNFNSLALDGILGGVGSVSASNVPFTLTAPSGTPTPAAGPTQSQNAVLRVTGALSGTVQITLPLPGYMIVENLTTGTFVLSFRAVAIGQVIAIEQGSIQHIYNDGTNVRFVNLPPVGSYFDICDATVPAWITGCSVPPYLNCDGTTFSAVTYPYLNSKLGGNTLPDFRGRGAFYLNQGTGRLTTTGAGIDGNTRFTPGGNNGITLALNQIPSITTIGAISLSTFNISGGGTRNNIIATSGNVGGVQTLGGSQQASPATGAGGTGDYAGVTSITGNGSFTYTNGGIQSLANAAPGVVSGIRLIRAA